MLVTVIFIRVNQRFLCHFESWEPKSIFDRGEQFWQLLCWILYPRSDRQHECDARDQHCDRSYDAASAIRQTRHNSDPRPQKSTKSILERGVFEATFRSDDCYSDYAYGSGAYCRLTACVTSYRRWWLLLGCRHSDLEGIPNSRLHCWLANKKFFHWAGRAFLASQLCLREGSRHASLCASCIWLLAFLA